MTGKAGQKCTAIRRAIVPRRHLDAVAARLRERLAKVERRRSGGRGREDGRAGVDGAAHGRRRARRAAVARQRGRVRRTPTASRRSARASPTARSSRRRLLLCRDAMTNDAVHDVEAFGPVSTLMPYGDFDEALALAARGRGSLVATLVTHDPKVAAQGDPADGRVAWPPARARPRGRRRIDRPRLALADAQARRPGPRRRRRGARRHPRRQALPAARGAAGLADDADGGDRRIRARRGAATKATSIRFASTSRSSRSATRCSRIGAP